MPDQILATLNQISQIGVEVTPGTPVTATRRLQSLGLPLSPAQNIQEFRPRGFKFATAHAETQRWSEGEIDDDSGLAYNEIQYVLASVFSKTTPTTADVEVWSAGTKVVGEEYVPVTPNGHVYRVTASDGSDSTQPTWPTGAGSTVTHEGVTWLEIGADTGSGYRWVFDMNTFARDDVQTYTIETGDSETGRSYRAAYCYFTGLEIESGRSDEISVSGDLVGRARQPFALTTSGIAEADLVPATPAHLNVYMDDTAAALGTTQLDGNFTSTISVTDRANQVWFHGRQYQGPAGRVENPPDATFELVQADGEEVDEMLLGLENGQRKFFRFEFVGPEIVPGLRYSFTWDISGNIGDAAEFDDEDGVHAVTVPFVAEHDGTWGRAMRVTLVNDMATL
jgi:hypothetical protein